MTIFYLVLGTTFGFVLSRSGAADYDYIQRMFLLESLQLYKILAAAILVTAPGLWAIQRRGRTLTGQRISIDRKAMNKGTIAGAALFGVGWSITGMCPGPIFVNIGEGKVYALAAVAGAFAGAALFGAVYERLQKPLGLPPLESQMPEARRQGAVPRAETAIAS